MLAGIARSLRAVLARGKDSSIDRDAAPVPDGTTWEDAFHALQQALDSAGVVDEPTDPGTGGDGETHGDSEGDGASP